MRAGISRWFSQPLPACSRHRGFEVRSWWWSGAVALILTFAKHWCLGAPTPSWVEQEARYDSTVWRREVEACKHELALVELRDRLRAATNKVSVLADFQFRTIEVPSPTKLTERLDLGIVRQPFDDTRKIVLPHTEWRDVLLRLYGNGWRVEQGSWHHEYFAPASAAEAAQSTFSFELHGRRLSARSRFIVKGTVSITWSNRVPDHLSVSNFVVLEHAGNPGFDLIGRVIPPAPQRRGELVDLHPIAVVDGDADQDEDIVTAGVNQILVNQGDATFKPMPFVAESVFHGARVTGVFADFNGDGFSDFLSVGSEGSWTNRLVLYPGKGVLPLNGPPFEANPYLRVPFPAVLSAGDVDSDGDLDVWLAQYRQPYVDGQMPTPYYDANDGNPSYLLLNDGSGRFESATHRVGLGAKSRRRVIGGSLVDLNRDGNLDLISVNDFCGVDLFYQDGEGKFSDETDRLYNRHLFGMTHCLGDFDRDGLLDFLVTGMSLPAVRRLEGMGIGRDDMPDRTAMRGDMSYGNRMYLQRGDRWIQPTWSDAIARTGWTWGSTAGDFDNDGDLEIYVANGHISGASVEDYDSLYWRHDIYLGSSKNDPALFQHLAKRLTPVSMLRTSWNGHQHNALLWDMGGNRYIDVAYLLGVAHETDCRAVISADLDNDGALDLVVSENEWMSSTDMGRKRLLIHRNTLRTPGRWIGAKLQVVQGAPSVFGAVVEVRTAARTFSAQLATGASYSSQHPNTLHFGLGEAEIVDTLTVKWPNGRAQSLDRPTLGRYHVFVSRAP